MKKMRKLGIVYYDGFFTGETLFFQLIKHDAKVLKIKVSDYCEHLWSGTWDRTKTEIDKFLKDNERLWK
jgi:hypothetical protein